MAITPPTYSPSGSIFGTTTTTTPYTYGDLTVPTTSAYNIWGSKGNPYYTAGPGYTPGAGSPTVPVPIYRPPVYGGGDSDGDYSGVGIPNPNEYDPSKYPPNYQVVEGPALETGSSFIGDDGGIDWGGIGHPDYTTVDGVGVTNPNGFYGSPDAAGSPGSKGSGFSFGGLLDNFSPLGLAAGLVGGPLAGLGVGWLDNNYLNPGTQDPSKVDIVDKSWGYGTNNNNWNATGFGNDKGRGFTSVKTFGDLNNPTAQEANRLQTEAQSFLAQQEARNQDPNYGFTPTDTITGDTGGWSNPAAGVNINTLGGRTGTTGLDGAPAPTVSWSDTPNSAGNTTGTFTSKEMGSTNVTDYGGGNYSIDVGEDDEVGWEDPGGDDDSGGGGSYIATAATQALGEKGLTVFNNWRDHMRNVVPEFTVSFGRYRVTAPKIVTAIDKKDNSKAIYKDIWDKHLKPIYALIVADRDSVKAQDDYRIMVRELMNKYLKGDK